MVSPVAPGLVIAGMHSHVGRTLVTAVLLRAFRNLYAPNGSVGGFKVGPDYIDPGYHQVASGHPSRNLDPVLCGEDAILPLYRYGAEGHRLAFVEGVIGLYDGRMNLAADAPRIPFGSTAHVAQLLIPGGFPEEHLPDLTQNRTLVASIRAAATAGLPIWAECAGLVYLSAALDGTPLAGVLPCHTTFSERLTMGYREATCTGASWAFRPGEQISGHEFHRTCITAPAARRRLNTAWQWESYDNQNVIAEGWVSSTIYASYLHTHPVARPAVARRFVRAAQHYLRPREGNA